MSLDVKWLVHSSFKLTFTSTVIYIDPFQIQGQPHDADYIFVTHTHHDHLSLEDIKKLTKSDTKFIVSNDGESQVRGLGGAISFRPYDSQKIDNLIITAIPAYNLNKSFHPKENNWLGYVIEFQDGTKFFHSGDSDNIPEYKELSKMGITIAALPCGGTYTMNATEAAQAAEVINPKQLIPMHWGRIVGSEKDALEVKKYLENSDIEVLILGQ